MNKMENNNKIEKIQKLHDSITDSCIAINSTLREVKLKFNKVQWIDDQINSIRKEITILRDLSNDVEKPIL